MTTIQGYTEEDQSKVNEIIQLISRSSFSQIQLLISEFESQFGTSFANINSNNNDKASSNEDNDNEDNTSQTQQSRTLLLTQFELSNPIKKRKFITGLVTFLTNLSKDKLGERFAKLPKISLTALTLDLSHANDVSDSKPMEVAINITPDEEKEFKTIVENIDGIKYIVK